MQISRRLLLKSAAATLAASPAFAQVAPGRYSEPPAFRLGRYWKVIESSPSGPHWEGTWTRSGETNFFQAYWKEQRLSKEEARDVVEFKRVREQQIELFRASLNGTYTGTISEDGLKIRGTASWYGPNDFWSAEIVL